MPPNKRRAAASWSLALLSALVGSVYYAQVNNLDLTTYAQSYEQEQLHESDGEGGEQSSLLRFQITRGKGRKRLDDIAQARAKAARLSKLYRQSSQPSPACHPHLDLPSSTSSWTWNGDRKFKRIYFYHARKAGGTSLAHYFKNVALHHGLEYRHVEWDEAEEPGTHEIPTFYVTHLREPVDRAISHFKYQGRWGCKDLSKIRRKGAEKFIPTEENANKLETWNSTGGHAPNQCSKGHSIRFRMGECATQCYVQWFSGACPDFELSTEQQYQVAMAKYLRYNFIVVLERLRDPEYVAAVEKFFGVPGVTTQRSAYCEAASHKANKMIPLTIKDETVDRLTQLNRVDIQLYSNLTDCLGRGDRQKFSFGKIDSFGSRVDTNTSIQVLYENQDDWRKENKMAKQAEKEVGAEETDDDTDSSEPDDGVDKTDAADKNKRRAKRAKRDADEDETTEGKGTAELDEETDDDGEERL